MLMESMPVSGVAIRKDTVAPGVAPCHVATIDQQIGVRRECVSPLGNLAGMLADEVRIEHALAEVYLCIAAMRNDVHGGQVAPIEQIGADLIDAVAVGIDENDFKFIGLIGAKNDMIDQLLVVRSRGIDKDDRTGLLLPGNLGLMQELPVIPEVTDLRYCVRTLIGKLERIGVNRVQDTWFERLDKHAIPP